MNNREGIIKKIKAYVFRTCVCGVVIGVLTFISTFNIALKFNEFESDRDEMIDDIILQTDEYDQKYKELTSRYTSQLLNEEITKEQHNELMINLPTDALNELKEDETLVEKVEKYEEVRALDDHRRNVKKANSILLASGTGLSLLSATPLAISYISKKERNKKDLKISNKKEYDGERDLN